MVAGYKVHWLCHFIFSAQLVNGFVDDLCLDPTVFGLYIGDGKPIAILVDVKLIVGAEYVLNHGEVRVYSVEEVNSFDGIETDQYEDTEDCA